MSSRRLFHKYGPACAKALCPHVIVDFGMIRARDVDERKFQAGIVDTEKKSFNAPALMHCTIQREIVPGNTGL